MEEYLEWFFNFLTRMLGGIWTIIKNIGIGLFTIFNVGDYINQARSMSSQFHWYHWVLVVLSMLLVYAIWVALIFLIVLGIRKYLRFRKTLVGSEDILEEMADLHRDVLRLTEEKEKILAMSVGESGISAEDIRRIFGESGSADALPAVGTGGAIGTTGDGSGQKQGVAASGLRFFRLNAVDEKYENYVPPEYDNSISLEELCNDFRNFCCSRLHLYYEIKTIRLMFAGLSSTKLIILQGISGTGKTSLPYAMGKYFLNDATIASVQPSWRDRTELFGYFNEFTKKFNETEVLKRCYEATYNDDINVIILDEMNISRVEYYFAEMLSILEMPDPNEWKLEMVSSTWPDDPKHLQDGKLQISQNIWFVGTANNDDSTFAVSDKVYDRALVINLDSKGVAFDAPDTPPKHVAYSHVDELYREAMEKYPVKEEYMDKIAKLDNYVIQKFRVAFGNRIIKQLHMFVPVYEAAGGNPVEALDYLLATKVFRKFEALNLSLIRDEIRGLINYLDTLFGQGAMAECIAYLERLRKMY
ncbi:MAG: hypothetical protein IJU20_07400 [Clostridia bacterium]|nr:hypothetical protein [Clostridia bacterium]